MTNRPARIFAPVVAICALALAPTLFAAPAEARSATALAGAKVETVYMIDALANDDVVTGSAAVLDDRFPPRFVIGGVQLEDGRLKLTDFGDSHKRREIALRPEIAKLFDGMKPAPHATLSPWNPLSPCETLGKDAIYDAIALDDGRLCMVLPGEPRKFSVPNEQGRICSITPFPKEGVLAAVSQTFLKQNSVVLSDKNNMEGIDVHTHEVIWSFPSANNALGVGRLNWVNTRYLLWTCSARHWCAFEVYDVKRQKLVAKGMQTDRDEGKNSIVNWRVSGNKVLEYYYETGKPKVVFDGGK